MSNKREQGYNASQNNHEASAGQGGYEASAGQGGYGPNAGQGGYGPNAGQGGYEASAGQSGYGANAGQCGYGPNAGQSGYAQHQQHQYGPSAQAGYGSAYGSRAPDPSFLQNLPNLLRSRQTEQFLLGAAIGVAAVWLLSDQERRGKLVKTGLKLYSGMLGGIEEMKEQFSDLKAEVRAEQQE